MWYRLSGASTACDFLPQLDPITLFGEHQGNHLACIRGAMSYIKHVSVLPEYVPLDLYSNVTRCIREDRISPGPEGTPEGEEPEQGSSGEGGLQGLSLLAPAGLEQVAQPHHLSVALCK